MRAEAQSVLDRRQAARFQQFLSAAEEVAKDRAFGRLTWDSKTRDMAVLQARVDESKASMAADRAFDRACRLIGRERFAPPALLVAAAAVKTALTDAGSAQILVEISKDRGDGRHPQWERKWAAALEAYADARRHILAVVDPQGRLATSQEREEARD